MKTDARTHWYKNSSKIFELVIILLQHNNDGDLPIPSQNREQDLPNAPLITRLVKVDDAKMDLSTNRSEGKYQISVPTLTFRPQRRESYCVCCFVTLDSRHYPQILRTRMQRFQPKHKQ